MLQCSQLNDYSKRLVNVMKVSLSNFFFSIWLPPGASKRCWVPKSGQVHQWNSSWEPSNPELTRQPTMPLPPNYAPLITLWNGYVICTSNHMFGRAIWNKLPECVFENFEIAQEKRGYFLIFQKSRE